MTSALIRSIRIQSQGCGELGSPFHAAILARCGDELEAGWRAEGLFARWADASVMACVADAVALRFLGGLHDLVLSGDEPDLAAAYPAPDRAADPDRAWAAAKVAITRHAPRLATFMAHEPQTNEVRRSICLIGGFLTVVKETGLPLRVFEIASSAGLNLSFDRYRYRMGAAVWGEPDALVTIDADWNGPPPPVEADLRVISRAACDRRPTELAEPAQRRRLLAYVWPDQFDRLARIHAAIDMAVALGTRVEAADAVDWTARKVTPQAGAATVLFHSVFWQYMPAGSQTALAAVIEDVGARASTDAPFAWLRMEPSPEDMARMEVRLTLWPTGETRVLAQAHPHGAWVKWSG